METTSDSPKIHGVMARFGDGEALVEAASRARAAGYTRMDGYSPIPVHGLYEAMGYRRSILAWLVGLGGLTGFLTACGLQTFCSAIDYPLMVGGRPFISWPSFVPICFELTVLFAALTAVFGMFGLNGLPQPYHPTFNVDGFADATVDKFFLCIEADDPHFVEADVTEFLNSLDAEDVSVVPL